MIDIKRLEVDEDYWGEVSPQGATDYALFSGGGGAWLKYDEEGIPHLWSRRFPEWRSYIAILPEKIIPCPTKQKEWTPEVDSKWEHHSGRVYQVVKIANTKTERPEQYPVTVVYENVENGEVWSRPTSEWARSFKPWKSQHERQREELEEDLVGILPFCEYSPEQIKELAQILHTQGYRKPKP